MTEESFRVFRRAAFVPKKMDNLRPEVLPFIGRTFKWVWVGTGGDDEPYPGQTRWEVWYKDHEGERLIDYWVPDEDLQDEPETGST